MTEFPNQTRKEIMKSIDCPREIISGKPFQKKSKNYKYIISSSISKISKDFRIFNKISEIYKSLGIPPRATKL